MLDDMWGKVWSTNQQNSSHRVHRNPWVLALFRQCQKWHSVGQSFGRRTSGIPSQDDPLLQIRFPTLEHFHRMFYHLSRATAPLTGHHLLDRLGGLHDWTSFQNFGFFYVFFFIKRTIRSRSLTSKQIGQPWWCQPWHAIISNVKSIIFKGFLKRNSLSFQIQTWRKNSTSLHIGKLSRFYHVCDV